MASVLVMFSCMNTAERIQQVVKAAGVPDRKVRSTLAKLCGISVQAVRDWFDGKTKNISHDHLIAISNAYGVSLDWLITGDDPNGGSVASDSDISRGLSDDQKIRALRLTIEQISDSDFRRLMGVFARRLAALPESNDP